MSKSVLVSKSLFNKATILARIFKVKSKFKSNHGVQIPSKVGVKVFQKAISGEPTVRRLT